MMRGRETAASGRAPIALEQAAEAPIADDPAVAVRGARDLGCDEGATEPLMRPLAQIVRDVLTDRPSQMALTERDDLGEALAHDGEHEALGEGVVSEYSNEAKTTPEAERGR